MPDQQVSAYPRHAIFIRREVEFGEVYFVEDDLISIPALRAGTAAGSADGRGMNRSMNIASHPLGCRLVGVLSCNRALHIMSVHNILHLMLSSCHSHCLSFPRRRMGRPRI